MKLTCEVQGRYVIYYNTRRGNEHKKPGFSSMAYVELCEVQVIGKNQNKKKIRIKIFAISFCKAIYFTCIILMSSTSFYSKQVHTKNRYFS